MTVRKKQGCRKIEAEQLLSKRELKILLSDSINKEQTESPPVKETFKLRFKGGICLNMCSKTKRCKSTE